MNTCHCHCGNRGPLTTDRFCEACDEAYRHVGQKARPVSYYTIEALPVYEDGRASTCDYRLVVWADYNALPDDREILDVVEAMDESTLISFVHDVHPEAKSLKTLDEERG